MTFRLRGRTLFVSAVCLAMAASCGGEDEAAPGSVPVVDAGGDADSSTDSGGSTGSAGVGGGGAGGTAGTAGVAGNAGAVAAAGAGGMAAAGGSAGVGGTAGAAGMAGAAGAGGVGGSSGCASGEKLCAGACVSVNDPAYGCGDPNCDPCIAENATAECVSGACAVGPCDDGFSDCNADPADGCEVDLNSDPENCAACGDACVVPNATPSCVAGSCGVASCDAGFDNCNGDPVDGCEANLNSDPVHCSACDGVCTVTDGTPECVAGQCRISNCQDGLGDCDGDTSNGCETNLNTSVTHCGVCNDPCNLSNATAACVSGTCEVDVCDAGFADCDSNPVNGCEVSLDDSATNCGVCDNVCDNPNGSTTCAAGLCDPVCDAGFDDCDGDVSNGCETAITSDTGNCGTCGNVCSADNGTALCNAGNCGISCDSGWDDCDGNLGNGCEASLDTVSHCGNCATACSNNNGGTSCVSGACVPSCASGFDDCNNNPNDGCETSLSTLTNCGGCGTVCDLDNAAETCPGGTCTLGACSAGFQNCDGNPANGCEASLNSVATCGDCTTTCSNPNGSTSCPAGVCVPVCAGGFADCNGDPNDGCETPLDTTSDCGRCGNICSTTNGSAACVSGDCSISCDTGWGSCDADLTNGCETALDTVSHCGDCSVACTNANGSTACSGGVCTPSCSGSFDDCNGNPNDGCETNLDTNVNNCGFCGTVCSCPSGTANCVGGVCGCSTCQAGLGDCDGDPANGCEASLDTLTDCGGCGNPCDLANASETCPGGTCTLGTCDAGWDNCDNDDSNGCETNTDTSVSSCGNCSTVCDSTNGTPTCALGSCGINCDSGWGNCDGDAGNGCEAALDTTANCGVCGNSCSNAHGSTACVGGTCSPTCDDPGWGDCNGDPNDGCETPLNTLANCGACGIGCARDHASASCSTGSCVLGTCDAGFDDCDGIASNGCEAALDTTSDCGSCGVSCSNANGSTACVGGACSPTCDPGWDDCNGNKKDGCETSTDTSANDCGACDFVCSSSGGTATCSGGNCGITCNPGFDDCDKDVTNGCEIQLNTVSDCGSCGVSCSNANGSTACVSGKCTPTCSPGWGSCNGDPNDGCEAPLNTLTNCGDCDTPCALANASESCSSGTCTLGACDSGFGNCDGLTNNGCENSLDTTADCGKCGTACTNANGSTACVGGICTPTCDPGWDDCNGDPNDGCEANTDTDTSHCGSCTTVCDSSNGTATCSGGGCGITCNSGWGNCDSNASNGCETILGTTSDCAACGDSCTNAHGATACVSNTCSPTCDPDWDDCNSDPADGCETSLTTLTDCGDCGQGCDLANASESCSTGTCILGACDSGFDDCDGDPATGCEADLGSDVNHCSGCGNQCTNPNGSTACVGGTCSPTCDPGFDDCDGDPATGCEADLGSDVNHCSGCGNQCTNPNGSTACVGGTCSPTCLPGYEDCDSDVANGCETNTQTDVANCGACNSPCGIGESCIGGVCTPPVCGNGLVEYGEQCDDGNLTTLDGCDDACDYEIVQRINSLEIQKGPAPGWCPETTNQFGAALTNTALDSFNNTFASEIEAASLNTLMQFHGLDDLTGQSDASFQIETLGGDLDPRYSWTPPGSIDAWFVGSTAAGATPSAASVTGGSLSADPSTLVIPFGNTDLTMLLGTLRATVDTTVSTPAPPPDPAELAAGFSVFETMTATGTDQGLCGNITVESLGQVPVPESLTSGFGACSGSCSNSKSYTYCGAGNPVGPNCNSLLDVLIGGCKALFCSTTVIIPTQPDVGVGSNSPNTLTNDPNNNNKVTVVEPNDAYSSYFHFTSNRAHLTNNL